MGMGSRRGAGTTEGGTGWVPAGARERRGEARDGFPPGRGNDGGRHGMGSRRGAGTTEGGTANGGWVPAGARFLLESFT